MEKDRTKNRYERLIEGEALVLNVRGNLWHWVPPKGTKGNGVSHDGRQAKCGSGTWVTFLNANDEDLTREFGSQSDPEDITCLTCQKRYADYCVAILKAQMESYSA